MTSPFKEKITRLIESTRSSIYPPDTTGWFYLPLKNGYEWKVYTASRVVPVSCTTLKVTIDDMNNELRRHLIDHVVLYGDKDTMAVKKEPTMHVRDHSSDSVEISMRVTVSAPLQYKECQVILFD